MPERGELSGGQETGEERKPMVQTGTGRGDEGTAVALHEGGTPAACMGLSGEIQGAEGADIHGTDRAGAYYSGM